MIFSLTHLNVNNTVQSIFPSEMKSSKVLNFEILGAPIGDFVFYAKYASQKCAKAQGLLHMLEDVGSVDPQVALLLLHQCGSFCKMVHLARSTPPSLMADAMQMFDNDIHHAFAECIAVDAFGNSWQQAKLSFSRGGLGLRSLSHHSAAAYISSVSASEQCTVSMSHLFTSVNLFNALIPPADAITLNDIVSSPCRQHALSSKIENHQFKLLFDHSSLPDRAHLLSVSSPNAAARLSVLPSPGLNLNMDPPDSK